MERRPSVCENCLVRGTKMKKCSRCKIAHYCNSDCQKVHWARHKPLCRDIDEDKLAVAHRVSKFVKKEADALRMLLCATIDKEEQRTHFVHLSVRSQDEPLIITKEPFDGNQHIKDTCFNHPATQEDPDTIGFVVIGTDSCIHVAVPLRTKRMREMLAGREGIVSQIQRAWNEA